MKMMRRLLCISALVALSGCRLDVTQTIDVTAAGREVVTYRETLDDEAFSATARLAGPYAFGFDAAKEDGWDVRTSSGPNEHTFLFTRSLTRHDAESQLTRLAYDSARTTPQDAFLVGPTAIIGVPITVSEASAKSASIPALLRPFETVTKDGRKDPAFQLANAHINATAVDAIVHVSIETRDATGVHRIEPTFAENTVLSPSFASTLHVGSPWPLSRLLAFWREVGTYGVFDFEHYSPPLCKADPKYHKSWMFGVGVYAEGARIPQELMNNALGAAEAWLAEHPVRCP